MQDATPGSEAPSVEARVEAAGWRAIAEAERFAERAALGALAAAGVAASRAEVALLLTDDARIAALNAAFRGRNAPTNVLSWPSVAWDGPASAADLAALGPAPFLGDVALSIETLRREAESFGRDLEHHAAHLIVHGVLHLLGYDHEDGESAARMEAVEDDALSRLGSPGRDA